MSVRRLLPLCSYGRHHRCSSAADVKKRGVHSQTSLSQDVGVYLHWPFCRSICHYCDFNKFVEPSNPSSNLYSNMEIAFLTSIDQQLRHLLGTGTPNITSIFWGGGTPTLAPISLIAAVTRKLLERGSSAVEVTIEANPHDITPSLVENIKSAGVNRLSIGVQSFNDDYLKLLGRRHNSLDAKRAIEIAVNAFGPENVSIDLMYGIGRQNLKEWDDDLQQAISFGIAHMSLYELTLKENTKFFNMWKLGKLEHHPPSDMYFHAINLLKVQGMVQYEVSNFSKKGNECSHNLNYWRCGQFLGIGPGAVGRYIQQLDSTYLDIEQLRKPKDWIHSVMANEGKEVQGCNVLSEKDLVQDHLSMIVRLREGVCLTHWRSMHGDASAAWLESTFSLPEFNGDFFVPLHDDGGADINNNHPCYCGVSTSNHCTGKRFTCTPRALAVGDAILQSVSINSR
eukprot:m.40637 g.40637  ORF g.40637 m.40637 type:complete len:453 (+) comp6937_c1_seq1:51-1409(+)